MATLRSFGLVEGYPDGTFKGDRTISRYEAALIVARSLARLETTHSSFITTEQLQQLRDISSTFEEELSALGVRIDTLEDRVENLDRRISEQERILFSGEFVSRYVGQSFRNAGRPNSGPGGTNYESLVGTLGGSNFLPHNPLGILPVIDYSSGRPLTNGTGFTSTLFLDTNFLLNQDWEGTLSLFAHSSQGDQIIDAVWGTQPGYLANPFTATVGLQSPQGRDRLPFTTAGFERLELRHQDGHLLTLGQFEPELLNPTVFLTPVNPNFRGKAVLGGFGFRGLVALNPYTVEVFGTKLPDGSPGQGGAEYDTNALGASAQYQDEKLTLTLNYLRTAQESSRGLPLSIGQVGSFNGTTGQLYANWVNPNGYFVEQLGGIGSPRVAGANSISDKRPVGGNPNSDDFGASASIGPQSQDSVGVSSQWNSGNWTLLGDYGFTHYRPNKNSSFSTTDSLWRVGAETRLFEQALKVNLDYRYTGARYDPMVLSFPTTATGTPVFRAYHRLPSFDQFWHLYSLHNTAEFPRNRKGFWLDTDWRYDPDGHVRFRYRNLEQVTTSLQDVRFAAGQLGPQTPNATVLGHSPGFLDVVFREYSPLSFNPNLNPLEDKRGSVESFALDVEHIFTNTPWRVDGHYEIWDFHRGTDLSAAQGGSQNLVDLKASVGSLSVGRSLGEEHLLTLGYQRTEMRGHYDPAGVYNSYAISRQTTDFRNRDTIQHIPFLRSDWQIAPDVDLETNIRHFFTHDRVPESVSAGALGGPNSLAHPFSWQGWQLSTTLRVRF